MNWKNISLKGKFCIGFGSILLLLLGVSLWSVTGIGTIVHNSEEVIHGNELKADVTQKTVDHLKWAEKVQLLLSDDTVHTLNVQTDPTQCGFGKWLYGQGRKNAEQLVPALVPVLKDIEAPTSISTNPPSESKTPTALPMVPFSTSCRQRRWITSHG